MLHRGVSIKKGHILATKEYKEKNFLSSYSFSVCVAEQFALMGFQDHALISGELGLFDNRILASSLLLIG